MQFFEFSNDGQNIIETNYWESEHAQKGYFYISINAGALRLLLPPALESAINEMRTAEYVIVSRGKYQGRDALELLFEDHSDSPYSLHTTQEQCDRLLPESDNRKNVVVTLWTRAGKQLELPGKFRIVKTLPDLSPWEE